MASSITTDNRFMSTAGIRSVRIYHNNLWARYKGAIFTQVFANSDSKGVSTFFVQVGETSVDRKGLGGADRSYHQYPYRLLFKGSYDQVPSYKLITSLAADLIMNPSDLVVLPGYHRPEYWVMLLICMLRGSRRAVFCDSTAFDREKSAWKEKAKAMFFRHCNGFFCYGSRSKQYVASYGIDPAKIYDGCQSAALAHGYDAATVRAHYAAGLFPADCASRFLYIGRLAEEKGLFDLLAAFARVRQELPAARLDLVGSGVLDEELRRRAEHLGIASSVAFLGTKTPQDIGQLLMNSAAMILPSLREPWGLVVNEALSFGCPVVVSDICGCVPELVIDGVTGYSFAAGDVGALAQAMLKTQYLSRDRAAVASRCLDVIAKFTPEHAAAQILRGCVEILDSPP